MSIASEIARISSVKAAILKAIRAKGVKVEETARLEDCPGYIGQIIGGRKIDKADAKASDYTMTLSFKDLAGEPKQFVITALAAVNSFMSGSMWNRTTKACVVTISYDGEKYRCSHTTARQGGGNQYSESAYSISYENGTFTITTTGPYFTRDVAYHLVYEYE